MGNYWGMGWGWWIIGPLMMVVFWGFVVWLIATFIRGADRGRDYRERERPAEIAARRYAAGEIDEREYERIINRLRNGPAQGGGT